MDSKLDTRGARLRWARKRFGIATPAEAIARLGVPKGTYGPHDNGHKDYGIKYARIYGKAFKVSWWWLYSGEGGPDDSVARVVFKDINPALADIIDRLIELPDTKVNKLARMFALELEDGNAPDQSAQPTRAQRRLTAAPVRGQRA